MHGEQNRSIANIYRSIGNIYFQKKDYDSAIKSYNKNIAILILFQDERHPYLANSFLSLGKIYFLINNNNKSIYYLSKYDKILDFLQIKLKLENLQIYEVFFNIFFNTKKLRISLFYLRKSLYIYLNESQNKNIKIG